MTYEKISDDKLVNTYQRETGNWGFMFGNFLQLMNWIGGTSSESRKNIGWSENANCRSNKDDFEVQLAA
jgi:hypothetical protein